MKKIMKRLGICLTISVLIWCAGLLRDRQTLRQNLIRLHVVANSDSVEDQNLKLQVRDAVVDSLSSAMAEARNVEEAKVYIQQNLPKIQAAANAALEKAGVDGNAVVSFAKEVFDTRYYETFKLPAGIYESLRITIGEGEGKNWWCVVFPSLCMPATTSGFADVAVGAGFADSLTATLKGEAGYEIRFFLLDQLGELENLLFQE